MSNFPIDIAQIVGLFMECIFYGIFLVTFGMCMNVLLLKKPQGVPYKHNMIIVALLMFVFATLDVAFGLRHNLDAFIYYTGPGGAKEEFAIISYWVNVMKSADYVAQTFIGDGMLLYRCYIVWGRQWVIVVLPAILWLAGTACGAVAVYIERTLHEAALLNTVHLKPFIDSLIAFTLTFNVITTSLIVYKIWSIDRATRRILVGSDGRLDKRESRLKHAMKIIVESGLMYSITIVIFFCVYLSSNNAQYGVSDVVVQVIGIVFNLIIIRVDQRATTEFTSQVPMSAASRVNWTTLRFVRRSTAANVSDADRIVGGDESSQFGVDSKAIQSQDVKVAELPRTSDSDDIAKSRNVLFSKGDWLRSSEPSV